MTRHALPRAALAPPLEPVRLLTGLWQIADMEKDGARVDLERTAEAMAQSIHDGFDGFDMADHYGSAEDVVGTLHRMQRERRIDLGDARPFFSTKWCPAPGPMTPGVVRDAVETSLRRMGVSRIDLLQFHWWTFEHPGYLDAMRALAALRDEGLIAELGVTNMDADHLSLLVRSGVPVRTNQVCFSLLDRRAAEDMTAFCLESGVRLLAYGTLAGGFLAERWLGRPEPADVSDWSKLKYGRFVREIGGWDALQRILAACDRVARRHEVSLSNVAVRWVLDQPAVACAIVGARLGESEHRADNARVFGFTFDAGDRAEIDAALATTRRIPGDCGDEYRRPPFLTASGDLSHHLDALPRVYRAEPMPERADRQRIDTGSVWEPVCGYSRAVRKGKRILVSGTTATHGAGEVVCPGDPAAQTVYILDKITASIAALGGRLADVVRTRIYVRHAKDWEAVARVHGRYFGEIRPANTLIAAGGLVGDYEVEIEAEAELD
jgi:aryl-alcohol dehydrogenase-like predicted oxidoreductase/enamine deaminase RidA (YjgF/YER057c/UK114 family)